MKILQRYSTSFFISVLLGNLILPFGSFFDLNVAQAAADKNLVVTNTVSGDAPTEPFKYRINCAGATKYSMTYKDVNGAEQIVTNKSALTYFYIAANTSQNITLSAEADTDRIDCALLAGDTAPVLATRDMKFVTTTNTDVDLAPTSASTQGTTTVRTSRKTVASGKFGALADTTTVVYSYENTAITKTIEVKTEVTGAAPTDKFKYKFNCAGSSFDASYTDDTGAAQTETGKTSVTFLLAAAETQSFTVHGTKDKQANCSATQLTKDTTMDFVTSTNTDVGLAPTPSSTQGTTTVRTYRKNAAQGWIQALADTTTVVFKYENNVPPAMTIKAEVVFPNGDPNTLNPIGEIFCRESGGWNRRDISAADGEISFAAPTYAGNRAYCFIRWKDFTGDARKFFKVKRGDNDGVRDDGFLRTTNASDIDGKKLTLTYDYTPDELITMNLRKVVTGANATAGLEKGPFTVKTRCVGNDGRKDFEFEMEGVTDPTDDTQDNFIQYKKGNMRCVAWETLAGEQRGFFKYTRGDDQGTSNGAIYQNASNEANGKTFTISNEYFPAGVIEFPVRNVTPNGDGGKGPFAVKVRCNGATGRKDFELEMPGITDPADDTDDQSIFYPVTSTNKNARCVVLETLTTEQKGFFKVKRSDTQGRQNGVVRNSVNLNAADETLIVTNTYVPEGTIDLKVKKITPKGDHNLGLFDTSIACTNGDTYAFEMESGEIETFQYEKNAALDCSVSETLTTEQEGKFDVVLGDNFGANNGRINTSNSNTVSGKIFTVTNTFTGAEDGSDDGETIDENGDRIDDQDDGDGIAGSIEDSFAPGTKKDGNGDGIKDSTQGEVSSVGNDVTRAHTTLDAKNNPGVTDAGIGCAGKLIVESYNVRAESSLGEDQDDYDYPVGLNDFKLKCVEPGSTVSVTFFYDKVYDFSQWKYRKKENGTYFDYPAVFENKSNGTQIVTTATIQVTDGGAGDTDGIVNGEIVDPSGPTPIPPRGSAPTACIKPLISDFHANFEEDKLKGFKFLVTPLQPNHYHPYDDLDGIKESLIFAQINGTEISKENMEVVRDTDFLGDSKIYVKVNLPEKEYFGEVKLLAKAGSQVSKARNCFLEKEISVSFPEKSEPIPEATEVYNLQPQRIEETLNTCPELQLKRYPLLRGRNLLAGSYKDASREDIAFQALKDLSNQKIIEGDDDTGFARLDEAIIRSETTKILSIAREDRIPLEECQRITDFPDVAVNSWAHDYIENIEFHDIIHGYDDGFYRPTRGLNEGEMYKVLALSFGLISKEEAINRVKEEGLEWHIPYYETLLNLNLIPEDINNHAPNEFITRGEFFRMLSNVLKYVDGINNSEEINSEDIQNVEVSVEILMQIM